MLWSLGPGAAIRSPVEQQGPLIEVSAMPAWRQWCSSHKRHWLRAQASAWFKIVMIKLVVIIMKRIILIIIAIVIV